MTGPGTTATSAEDPATAPKGERQWRDFLRVKVFLRPYAWQLGFMVLLSLAGTLLGLVQPYLSKFLVDNALLRRDFNALVAAAALMFAATVFGFVLSYISGYGYMRLSTAMLFDMRMEVYRHLHTLSPRFYARARMGDLISRLNGDVAEVQRISADSFLSSLSNMLFVAGSIAMMIWLSWSLFVVGIVLIPVSIVLFRYFQIHMTRLVRELREKSAGIGTLFLETLTGVRLVACLGSSDYELDRFRARNDSFVSTLLRFQNINLLGRTLPGTVLTAATVAVFLYGGMQIIEGRMTMGTLVAFMAYHARLLSPIQNLLGLSASLTSAKVSLGRVLELLDTAPEITEIPGALPIHSVNDGLAFTDVTLRHEGRLVLDHVSFHIPAGSFSVIAGPSGGGKSTIADLMVRLLDPDTGSVTIDGVDVRSLRLKELRRTVVLIEQSPHLFQGTIFDNIAYSRPDMPRVDVEAAARAAGLQDFLDRLPMGLDTIAGERGLTLSAGERQRIAIARAFLLSPEVLILDEPSAALDAAGERLLLENLREQFRGKTLVAITHKPLLAEAADHVFHVDGGRVADSRILV